MVICRTHNCGISAKHVLLFFPKFEKTKGPDAARAGVTCPQPKWTTFLSNLRSMHLIQKAQEGNFFRNSWESWIVPFFSNERTRKFAQNVSANLVRRSHKPSRGLFKSGIFHLLERWSDSCCQPLINKPKCPCCASYANEQVEPFEG